MNTPESSQSDIDAAADRINSALAGLRKAADKAALEELIGRADAIDLIEYS